MEITINRVTLADAELLSLLSSKTFYNTFVGTCTQQDMNTFLEENYNINQIKKELKNENDFYYFAQINNTPVGYIRFMEDYSNFELMKQYKAIELKRIYILNEFHGKGIAQKLLEFVFDYCVENKYQAIWLGVWEHNIKAQKFYIKNGFKNSGYTHNFPIVTTPQTDYWFWKFFN